MKLVFTPTTISWLYGCIVQPNTADVREILKAIPGVWYNSQVKQWMVPVDCMEIIKERADDVGYTTTISE